MICSMQTDGQTHTDMTILIVAFGNFANVSKSGLLCLIEVWF